MSGKPLKTSERCAAEQLCQTRGTHPTEKLSANEREKITIMRISSKPLSERPIRRLSLGLALTN